MPGLALIPPEARILPGACRHAAAFSKGTVELRALYIYPPYGIKWEILVCRGAGIPLKCHVSGMRRLFSLEPFSLSSCWFSMNMVPDCSLNASIWRVRSCWLRWSASEHPVKALHGFQVSLLMLSLPQSFSLHPERMEPVNRIQVK